MLNIFKFKNKCLIKVKISNTKIIKKYKKYTWIDIVNPNKIEEKYIKKILKKKIIFKKRLLNIESSARFYKNRNGLHINSFFLYKKKNHFKITTITFILKSKIIFSLREREISSFRLYRIKAKKQITNKNPYEILLNILEIKIEQLADKIELNANYLEKLSKKILTNRDKYFDKSISLLSNREDIISKIRICLIDTQRALKFLTKENNISTLHKKQITNILIDIKSLIPYNESLFQKISILIQSSMGFLNIEQNKIIKIFSIISIIFLPPTLITSIYGMNFKYIPELEWHYSYIITLINMFILGTIPYIYFKFKKWL